MKISTIYLIGFGLTLGFISFLVAQQNDKELAQTKNLEQCIADPLQDTSRTIWVKDCQKYMIEYGVLHAKFNNK